CIVLEERADFFVAKGEIAGVQLLNEVLDAPARQREIGLNSTCDNEMQRSRQIIQKVGQSPVDNGFFDQMIIIQHQAEGLAIQRLCRDIVEQARQNGWKIPLRMP